MRFLLAWFWMCLILASILWYAFLLFYVLLHVAAHGYPRYRLPAMPAVFLVAAHEALHRAAGPKQPPRR